MSDAAKPADAKPVFTVFPEILFVPVPGRFLVLLGQQEILDSAAEYEGREWVEKNAHLILDQARLVGQLELPDVIVTPEFRLWPLEPRLPAWDQDDDESEAAP
jgi:hypothetical protein